MKNSPRFELQTGVTTKEAHNAVFIGGPGTGKTHLATAIGVEAIQKHGKRMRFFSTAELVNVLMPTDNFPKIWGSAD